MKSCMISVRNSIFDVSDRATLDTNDANLASILGADKHFWCGERDLSKFDGYEMFCFTMTKIKEAYENEWMELITLLRNKYGSSIKITVYQEAEVDWVIKRSIEEQTRFIKILRSIDVFFAHNSADAPFFKYLAPNTTVIPVPSPINFQRIQRFASNTQAKLNSPVKEIIFGSSFDDRSYGLFGYAVGAELKRLYGEKVKLTQFHRTDWKDGRTEKIREAVGVDFEILPHMGWLDYAERISKCYLMMNLMPAAAAGRDAIICAAMDIPHIGNKRLEIIQYSPSSVDVFDLEQALLAARVLIDSQEIYTNTLKRQREELVNHSLDAVRKYLTPKLKEIGISI